jgi:hypothetical protein
MCAKRLGAALFRTHQRVSVAINTARVPPPPHRASPPLPFSVAAAQRCQRARTCARCAHSFAAAASCVKFGARAKRSGAAQPGAFGGRAPPLRMRATIAVTCATAIPRAAAVTHSAATVVLRHRCANGKSPAMRFSKQISSNAIQKSHR